jgi:hypothetical protein
MAYLIIYLLFVCLSLISTNNQEDLSNSFLLTIIEQLKAGENVIFTKFGDGEYNCMIGVKGCNSDQDTYHPWLARELKKSLIGLTEKGAYIGKWAYGDPAHFYDQLVFPAVIRWRYYQLLLNYDKNPLTNSFMEYPYLYKFVEYLSSTTRHKVVICNARNNKLNKLLRSNIYIEMPYNNWSFDYQKWKHKISEVIEKNSIVVIAAGMCSKVLINDLAAEHEASF